MQICNDIITFAASIRDNNITAVIFLIVPWNDDFNDKSGMVNC